MQVSLEVLNNVERRLNFVIPADLIEEAYKNQINRYSKNANIKGFRPGKVPASVIQQRFGEEARREAYGSVIQKALINALQENKLNPINTPQIETKSMLANQPFEFVASFEVLPTIEKVNFTLENIEKLNVEVTDEDIQNVIKQLRKQYTKWTKVDREAREADRVVIDYHMIVDGKPDLEHKIERFPVELGSKVMLPGFEEGLIGVKTNDEKTLNLTFPENFPVAERAGKPFDFVITIKEVYEADQPEMNENLIHQLGIASGKEEDLHKQIRQTLGLERDRLTREKQKEQVFNALLNQNEITVPPSMIAKEAKSIHDEIYQNQQHDHHNHSEKEMSSFNEVAKKRVALGLLISEYARVTNVMPDAERVTKRIQEIASIYEKPQEVISWLSTQEQKAGIEAQVLEDQIIEKLLESVPVIEKTISYAELKGISV